jgi:Tfp pilus assembly protein PilF
MASGRKYEVEMNRIEILKGFLKENANDSFSRYALALEYVKLGQNEDAVNEFETVKKKDPDYVATYFQLGQLYLKMGQTHEAEKTFRTGITVAVKIGDDHTRSELEAAVDGLA